MRDQEGGSTCLAQRGTTTTRKGHWKAFGSGRSRFAELCQRGTALAIELSSDLASSMGLWQVVWKFATEFATRILSCFLSFPPPLLRPALAIGFSSELASSTGLWQVVWRLPVDLSPLGSTISPHCLSQHTSRRRIVVEALRNGRQRAAGPFISCAYFRR